MDNKRIASRLIVGTIGLTIGLAFMRSGTKTILDGVVGLGEQIIEKRELIIKKITESKS